MPKYTNNTIKHQGNEYLTIPPRTSNMDSVYFFDIQDVDSTDCEPYYNPVLYKDIFNFTGGESYTIEFPHSAIGKNAFLYIQPISNTSLMTDIEIIFNSTNNLPSLPIGNTMFSMNNNNRIKRVYINIAPECAGELVVLVTDKYVVSESTLDYDYKA